MPTGNYPSLLDIANLTMPDGKLAAPKEIIELLNQNNEIWEEAMIREGNDGSGHKSVTRTGLPLNTWRKLYKGVVETKSTTAQVRDTAGMLENYATIDKAEAELNGNSAAWRLTQEGAYRESMNEDVSETFIYGDTTLNPERFNGIAPRFNTSVAANADNAQNVIKAGGAGADNTSIYVTVWGPQTSFFFYPKGSFGGLRMRDLGEQTIYDASGDPFQALRTHYKWDIGLAVPDWRYTVRIANIDISDLTKTGSTGADLNDLLAQAIEQLPTDFRSKGRPAIYMNRTVRSFFRRQLMNKSNYWLTADTVNGKRVMAFDDIPVRRLDRIRITESLVP